MPSYVRNPFGSPVTIGLRGSSPETIKHENQVLHSRLRQLQQDLQIEQGKYDNQQI